MKKNKTYTKSEHQISNNIDEKTYQKLMQLKQAFNYNSNDKKANKKSLSCK